MARGAAWVSTRAGISSIVVERKPADLGFLDVNDWLPVIV
jgi:hypothetical protein